MTTSDLRCIYQGKPIKTISAEENQFVAGYAHHHAGKKKALLMLHGFSSTPAVFRNLLPHLSHYNAIIAPTLPGHGKTPHHFSSIKANEWLSYVENEFKQLSTEYETVDVLGLSLGGLLAGYLSQKFTINHLYLLAPAFDLKRSIPILLPFVSFLNKLGFCYIRAKAGNIFTKQYCEIAYRQLPLTAIIEILTLIQSYPWVTPTCPTDLFLGVYDNVIDSKKVEARFKSAPNVHIHWLKHSAHVLPLDGDVDVILKCIHQHSK